MALFCDFGTEIAVADPRGGHWGYAAGPVKISHKN